MRFGRDEDGKGVIFRLLRESGSRQDISKVNGEVLQKLIH